MPQLRSEMERYLCGWQDDLSAAWREGLDGAAPNFDAIPQDHPDASLEGNGQIIPCRDGRGPLYALEGIDPSDVSVVVIGNDPYPDPQRATGRSFEQGDLDSWIESLSEPGRVSPSLLNLVCAAAALLPNAAELGLACADLHKRREKLRDSLNGIVVLPPPRSMFEILTGQGVLWLNRTPTISTHRRRPDSTKEHERRLREKRHRWHRALWRPVTLAILSSLVDEARARPIVFALFGGEAKGLRRRVETRGRRLGVPSENVRFVESEHPCRPAFFDTENPLGRINYELSLFEREPIDWCGPNSQRTVEDAPNCLAPPTRASQRSIAIMDRAVGRYRTTLRQLAQL